MKYHSKPVAPAAGPAGVAFAISDLLLMKRWADLHDVVMTVRLDHGVDDEQYEEVVAFRTDSEPGCFLLVWRNDEAVFAQPLVGRTRRYRSVSHILDSITIKQPAAR